MKRNFILLLVWLLGACMLTASCSRILEGNALVGEQIHFTASTSYLNSRSETRTAYSGDIYSEFERIEWVVGDRFRIASPQATHRYTGNHFADYTVTGVSEGSSGKESNAAIAPSGGNGLVWETGKHDFYCVYPDPGTNTSVSIAGNVIHGVIPAVQTVTWDGNIARPDMDYAYMYAAVRQVNPQSNVELFFKPMVTAFQVTVATADDEELTLEKFRLVSGSCALAGEFTATVTAATTSNNLSTDCASFDCPAFSDAEGSANHVVEVDLGGFKIYKTAAAGHPTTASFTVFALPQDLTDISLQLVTSAGTRKLALNQNNAAITFPACHKAYINNLGIPGTWQYHMDPIDDILINDETVLTDTERPVVVHTYKSATGMAEVDIPWKMYFTTENPAGKTRISDFSSIHDTPCTTDEAKTESATVSDYAYLVPSAVTGNGTNNPVDFLIGASPLPPANPAEVSINREAILNNYNNKYQNFNQITDLRSRAHNDLDLSTYDFMSRTAGHSSETANCYIIDGYGTFRIPLVYGNAIKNGQPNTASYSRTASDSRYLNKFLNAQGNAIGSPYILEDPNLVKSGNYEGRVVWQDVRSGYEILRDENISIEGNYLKFKIEQIDLKPGNIVLALYDKGTKTILWSWHLWVFGEDFYTRKVSLNGQSTTFLSVNLGWTAPLKYPSSKTNGRKQYAVIAVDDGTEHEGTVLGSFSITQAVYTVPGSECTIYSGTFYQFGCKNPYLPISGEYNKDARFNTTIHPEYQMNEVDPLNRSACKYTKTINGQDRFNCQANTAAKSNAAQNIVFATQNPHIFIADYVYHQYANAWNVTFQYGVYDTPLEKSVYDPCPRGFSVPRRNQFLVLFDPARDATATGDGIVNPDKIALGYGDPTVAGTHEIFGEKYECQWYSGKPSIGGIEFYTDNRENDLDFPFIGYRGGLDADGQPLFGGLLRNADFRPDYEIYATQRTGSSFSSAFLYSNRILGEKGLPSNTFYAALYTLTNSWGLQVRPVVDNSSVSTGVSTGGINGQSHDFGDRSWD